MDKIVESRNGRCANCGTPLLQDKDEVKEMGQKIFPNQPMIFAGGIVECLKCKTNNWV